MTRPRSQHLVVGLGLGHRHCLWSVLFPLMLNNMFHGLLTTPTPRPPSCPLTCGESRGHQSLLPFRQAYLSNFMKEIKTCPNFKSARESNSPNIWYFSGLKAPTFFSGISLRKSKQRVGSHAPAHFSRSSPNAKQISCTLGDKNLLSGQNPAPFSHPSNMQGLTAISCRGSQQASQAVSCSVTECLEPTSFLVSFF